MTQRQIIDGSIKKKVISSDLIEERNKKDFKIESNYLFNLLDQNIIRSKDENWKFMESIPSLHNSHKFYDMTKEEMWIDHMKKLRTTFEHKKDQFFVNQKTTDNLWSYWHLG